MYEIEKKINSKRGGFYVMENNEQLAEMEVGIIEDTLTVFHTEVTAKAEGKGLAKLLLSAMVAHARENGLQVVPLCMFVLGQFQRHPEEYADIWKKDA